MRYTDIDIVSPCGESRNNMQKVCDGMICSSCNTKVFDFRDKTEAEFQEIFLNQKVECAIFYEDQINPEVYVPSSFPKFALLVISFLAIFGLQAPKAIAQSKIQKTEQLPTKANRNYNVVIPNGNDKQPADVDPKDEAKKEAAVTDVDQKAPKKKIKRYRRRFLGIFPRKRRALMGCPRF